MLTLGPEPVKRVTDTKTSWVIGDRTRSKRASMLGLLAPAECVYCYLRTDPEKVIGRELVDDFVKHLAAFGATELAGAAPLSPWLTLHLNGMRHEVHNDSENGTYGYLYSLTSSVDTFTGGETCVARKAAFRGPRAATV